MYVPERYTFHTFSDAAANNDRVVTRREVVICCKILEVTANVMANFPLLRLVPTKQAVSFNFQCLLSLLRKSFVCDERLRRACHVSILYIIPIAS
jgi:hypothetical protein